MLQAETTKVSMNSLQHGANSQALVLSNESPEKFHELLQTYIDDFQPRNGVEMKLIEEMVAAKWRQQRIWVIQTTAIELEMDSQRAEFQQREIQNGPLNLTQPSRVTLAFTAISNKEKTLELLLRHETAFNRMHDRAMKALYRMREESKLQNDPNPQESIPQTLEPDKEESNPEPQIITLEGGTPVPQPAPRPLPNPPHSQTGPY